MNRRALTPRLLSSLALSNTAVVWSVALGALGILVFVPVQGAAVRDWPALLVAAALAEATFAATVVAVRAPGGEPGPLRVAIVLLLAGTVRGVTISGAANILALGPVTAGDVVGRAANSALFCLLGGALIGATLAWRMDFREQYRALVDRALLLEHAGEDAAVDRDVLAAWASIKAELDDALQRASGMLASGATARHLTEAAAFLTSAVDTTLRPASRALWTDVPPERPPLSTRSLLTAALGAWQLPLRAILAFFGVLVGVGSIVRVGLVPGLWFTVVFMAITAVVLGLSMLATRYRPERTAPIAACTLVVLPLLLLVGMAQIADGRFGLAADRVSELIVALQAPITTVLITMAVEAGRQRQRILAALQARVDAEAIGLLDRAGGANDDAQRLSVFMHHSVQSDLAASAMQLREAALSGEPETMRGVGAAVLMRLGALESLDAAAPPWLGQPTGYERIAEIVGAWSGILDVRVSLPEAGDCRRHQWLVATQVIEEGLANAARHGDASRVVIDGRVDDGRLILSIEDDGRRGRDPGAVDGAGIGLQWLDRVAPGDWSLRHSAAGSVLVVTVR